MKQAVQQSLAGQVGINQLDIGYSLNERPPFHPGFILRKLMDDSARRRISRIQIGTAHSLRFRREKLEHDATRTPAMLRTAGAAGKLLGHSEPYPGWDLLRAQEILMRG